VHVSVQFVGDRGGVSYHCGAAGALGPGGSPGYNTKGLRQRALSDAERDTLRQLYRGARLFDGGHVGGDYSVSDFPFLILIVRSLTGMMPPVVVLVLMGNPTFGSGPRKALLDWLLNTRATLAKS
jgi:hypothetical protein